MLDCNFFPPLRLVRREMRINAEEVSDELDEEQVPADYGGVARRRQLGVGARHARERWRRDECRRRSRRIRRNERRWRGRRKRCGTQPIQWGNVARRTWCF